jgi:hypothetical protein
MATTVASIITAARDVHAAFGEENVSPGAAVRMVDRAHRRLYFRTARTNPDRLATRQSALTFAQSTAAAGYSPTSGFVKIVSAQVGYSDGTRMNLSLVDSLEKTNVSVHPAAFIENGKLYPIDPTYDEWGDSTPRTGWNTASYIYVIYVAAPTAISQLKASGSNTNIELPDYAFDALVGHVAYMMATRMKRKIGDAAYGEIKSEYGDALNEYLRLLDSEVESKVRFVRVLD